MDDAEIDQETVMLYGNSARIRGTIDIRRSQIRGYDVNGSNDNNGFLTYGARSSTTDLFRIIDSSSVLIEDNGRTNLLLSEVSGDSSIIAVGGQVYIYLQNNGILNNCTFRGIRTLETPFPPATFNNVSLIDTEQGMNLWEVSRIDRYGINIPSTTSGYTSRLGPDHSPVSGNVNAYDWNAVAFDSSQLILTSVNNRYYEGYTASYEFRDDDGVIEDALIIYRDNRSAASGTTLTELGRYTTDSSGHLTGTYDSRTGSTVTQGSLPVLYIRTGQSNQTGSTTDITVGGSSYTHYNYNIDEITHSLEIRSYGHLPMSDTHAISSQIGRINADLTVAEYVTYGLLIDEEVTATKAVADAYTTIDSPNELYDRFKSYWRDNDDVEPITKTAASLDLGDYNLTINSNAVSAFAVSGTTITIKSDEFVADILVETTGTLTLQNDAIFTGSYQDSSGKQVRIKTNPAGTLVRIVPSTGSTVTGTSHSTTGVFSATFNPTASLKLYLKAIGYEFRRSTLEVEDVIGTVGIDLVKDGHIDSTIDISGFSSSETGTDYGDRIWFNFVNTGNHPRKSHMICGEIDTRGELRKTQALVDDRLTTQEGLEWYEYFIERERDATNEYLADKPLLHESDRTAIREDYLDFVRISGMSDEDYTRMGIPLYEKDETTRYNAPFSNNDRVTFDFLQTQVNLTADVAEDTTERLINNDDFKDALAEAIWNKANADVTESNSVGKHIKDELCINQDHIRRRKRKD